MAQAWESKDIRKQGDLYNQAKAKGDKTGMQAASAEANRLRALQNYKTDASGLNATSITNNVQQPIQPKPQIDIAALISQEFAKQNQAQQQQETVRQQNMLAEIERAKNERISSRNSALKGLLDKTQSNLAAEKATVSPRFQTLKNNESSTAQLRAKRIGEIMAAKGYSEGYQGQDEIANNVAYRTNLGNLNTQEQGVYNDIAKRGTDAQTEYQSGLVQAEADADTLAAEQRLAELGTQRDYARQDERNAIADERYNQEYADKQAGQQKQEYVNTIDRFSKDYTAEINNIKGDGDTTNDWQIPYLESARTQKIANQQAVEAKANEAKTAAQQQMFENALVAWKESGVATQQMAAILGVPVGAKTASYNIDNINAAINRSQVAISQQNANTNANQLAWAKDPNNPSNQKVNTNTTFTIDDWGKTLDNEFLPKYDSYGDIKIQGITNTADREKRILALGLPTDMTKALYLRYNIPLPR